MVPHWLHLIAIAAVALGALCAALMAVDVMRHPQQMWIMNIVWPVTALFAGPLAVWGYWRYGRLATHAKAHAAMQRKEEPPSKRLTPFPAMVGKGAAHCGSGCTLGDVVAEWLAFAAPGLAVWFGWKSVFPDKMFAVWIIDYIFAFSFGIAFQYFTIKPMRGLGVREGLRQAVKADAASLTAWQIGMYGFMAFASLYLFREIFAARLRTNSFEFWFMMQIAMLSGFLTSYPVNWWLIEKGVKERM
jgi:hypothetical protein